MLVVGLGGVLIAFEYVHHEPCEGRCPGMNELNASVSRVILLSLFTFKFYLFLSYFECYKGKSSPYKEKLWFPPRPISIDDHLQFLELLLMLLVFN